MNEPLYELYGDLPKVPAMPYPSFEEYGAGLRAWQERWPQRMTLETPGHTLEGRPIYLARVTDRTVPDDDKQIFLVNGNHSAGEISPVCGILHFLKWLLSDDPGAARLQEVRHNGHLLEESTTDGYLVHHRQGTVVQVNIPPDKVHDLHVVTIRYEAAQRPIQGFATEDWRSEALRIPAR